MEILEKVAYLKGLAEGLGLDTKSKEGKLFTIMMDILDDIALELQDLQTGQEDLEDALDGTNVFMGTFYLSSDLQHLYKRMDDNSIVQMELDD